MIEFGKPRQQYPGLKVMWGDRSSCAIHPEDDQEGFVAYWQERYQALGVQSLFFIKQEHTVDGRVLIGDQAGGVHFIDDQDGDYLITNAPGVGIGVGTADCVPMIFFDPVAHVIGAAHAGWKGTVGGIAPIMLRQMQQNFGLKVEDVKVSFGPHAKVCCYEVSADFRQNLLQEIADQVLEQRDGKWFFSGERYNRLLLQFAGVQEYQFNSETAECTMCNRQFHSRRNDGPDYVGQMSIAWMV